MTVVTKVIILMAELENPMVITLIAAAIHVVIHVLPVTPVVQAIHVTAEV